MQATAIRTAKAATGGAIQGLEPTGIETDYPVRGRKQDMKMDIKAKIEKRLRLTTP